MESQLIEMGKIVREAGLWVGWGDKLCLGHVEFEKPVDFLIEIFSPLCPLVNIYNFFKKVLSVPARYRWQHQRI